MDKNAMIVVVVGVLFFSGFVSASDGWAVTPVVCNPTVELIGNTPVVHGDGKVSVKVTNKVGGSSYCSMEIAVRCNLGYSSSTWSPIGDFNESESKNIDLDLSCWVSQETTDRCTVTVQGARGEKASTNFTVLCKEPAECSPLGGWYCDGSNRVYCTADGKMDTPSVVSCAPGFCITNANGAECSSPQNTNTGSLGGSQGADNSGIILAVAIILILFVVIIGLLIYFRIGKKQRPIGLA